MEMKTYQEKIIHKLKDVLAGHKTLLFAYLYGSMYEDSDVDIAVYLAPSSIEIEADYNLDLNHKLEDSVEKEVDLLILNTAPLELAYSAHKGLLVFEKDKRARVEFEVNIRKKYWDFVPILRIYLNTSLKALPKLKKEYENAARNKR